MASAYGNTPLPVSGDSFPVTPPDDRNMTFWRMNTWSRLNESPTELQPSVNRPKQKDVPVYLTWENLWVTATGRDGSTHTVLSGLTGFARPAEVLAIMGPSGCGKTTLLDVLAGRLTSRMTKSGTIHINGQKQALSYGTSAYVTQEDVLLTTLTVREAIYYSAELLLPESMSRSQKRKRADTVIMEMGLQSAMDIRIGGRNSKGISGGQRRRVSICIEILTRPKLLFLDEPTSGLDSAASYHVMSRIVNQAQQHGGTVIASIHQPSSEVFALFNNLYLLCAGKTIFFGPTSSTAEFFASSGFPCRQLRNPSDHFLRTINKDFDAADPVVDHLRVDNAVGIANTAEAIDTLIESYKSSNICRDVKRQVAEIGKRGGMLVTKEQAKFITQCVVLTKRSFTNMTRDIGYYWLRLAIYIVLGLSIGTVFYNLGNEYSSIQARGAMLAYTGGYLTFMAIGGFPSFVEDLKIFYREQLNGHYGTGSFIIANSISSTPFLLLITFVPAVIAYYLAGLQRSPGHFIFFCLILYSSMLLVESLMMIIATLVPDFLMGIITGAGIQGLMLLACGFYQLPNALPKPVWTYPGYYIAFQRFTYQGSYKNEYYGLTFPSSDGNSTISGTEIVRDVWQMQVGYSKWVDLIVLIGMIVFYRFAFWAAIKIREELKVRNLELFKKKTRVMEMSSLHSRENNSNERIDTVEEV